ncbi:MAG: four helix bundle protein [Chitinophagaceae bacterium]|nr:MAG: four helix bundle protein [Chitinophagaceae bacterium]
MYLLEELEIYNLAQEDSDKIWKIVDGWDPFPKWRIGSQFTEAADSISSNIAEGYGRYFFKQQIVFCFYARGSLMESKNWLFKARKRNLIDDAILEELVNDLRTIHKKLNSYVKRLKQEVRKVK